jgi:hypothetical protein
MAGSATAPLARRLGPRYNVTPPPDPATLFLEID